MAYRRKYFFLPVIFSLTCVTVSMMFYIWPICTREHLRAKEVIWYYSGDKYMRVGIFKVPNRDFIIVTFTGDTADDRIRLDFGQHYIRGMLAAQDTIHGISFQFGPNSKYSTFVAVLDVGYMEDAKTYVGSDDGIKVYYMPAHELNSHIKHVKVEPIFL